MAKWKLPISHELFQTQSIGELITEQFRDLYEEKASLESRLKAGHELAEGELARVHERLRSIDRALVDDDAAPPFEADDLVAFWESEVAAGRTPNLAMLPADIPKTWRRE